MHGGNSGPKNDKTAFEAERRALRQRLIAAREALAPDLCASYSAGIRNQLQQAFPALATQRVAFCWPIRNEPDLRPLMRDWLAADDSRFMALLPVVTAPGEALVFRRWTLDTPLEPDRYGIPTPSEGEAAFPDTLLIPVNAFDAQGYRLGYGGGFFDRTLATLRPSPFTIGVGFELSRVATIWPQAHDMRLDAVVTEAGVFRPPAR